MLVFLHKLSFCLFFTQLEKGVDGLFDSFARLDSRISSVGQTAAKIGDHLQVMWFYQSWFSITIVIFNCFFHDSLLYI